MLKVTDAAIKQIKESATQSNMVGMPLRVAASRNKDGSINYGMGFDENKSDDDAVIECDGIEVIVGPSSRDLLTGCVLDYVELDSGEMNFIFINPNDPSHGQAQQ